jgi:hypothetical protein
LHVHRSIRSFLTMLMTVGTSFLISTATHDASAECQPDAPVPELKVVTEIESYSPGDEFATILGNVRKDIVIAGENVTMLIMIPDESVRSEITPVDPADGSFVYMLPLDVTDERRFGRYNVTASYSNLEANWSFVVSPGIADYPGALIRTPQLRTIDGDDIASNELIPGQQIIVSTEIKNPWDWKDQPVVAVMQVRDSKGLTV